MHIIELRGSRAGQHNLSAESFLFEKFMRNVTGSHACFSRCPRTADVPDRSSLGFSLSSLSRGLVSNHSFRETSTCAGALWPWHCQWKKACLMECLTFCLFCCGGQVEQWLCKAAVAKMMSRSPSLRLSAKVFLR